MIALNALPDGSTPTRVHHLLTPVLLEREAEHERLGDGLERELVSTVPYLVQVAVGRDHGDAERPRVRACELRDVRRHGAARIPPELVAEVAEILQDRGHGFLPRYPRAGPPSLAPRPSSRVPTSTPSGRWRPGCPAMTTSLPATEA